MINKLGIFFLTVFSLLLFGQGADQASAGSEKTIAIFPFEVFSKDDLSFLGRGVTRMISSRTGDSGQIKVQLRPKSLEAFGIEINPEVLETLGTSEEFSGVEFFVRGSVTILESAVSTDADLIDLKKGRVVCSFHESGSSQEDIVRHASVIAEKIKKVVLGGHVPAATTESFHSPGAIQFKESAGINKSASLPLALKTKAALPVTTEKIFKSQTFEKGFFGIASGDVDGDGNADLVLMDAHSVNLFSFQQGDLVKKGVFKGENYETFKGVDLADLNQNNRAELFITAVDRKGGVCSLVLEWENGVFQTIVPKSDWYYRVIPVNGKKGLYGQQGGYSEFFSGGVFSLAWDGSNYVKKEAVPLPPDVDIFSFIKADLLGTGSQETLWLDNNGNLNLSLSNDKIEWSSTSSFGSTPLFLGEKAGQDLDDQERLYINSRMAVTDLDGDGINEAILVHNRDLSKGFLGRFRKFTSGSVTSLTWNASGMKKAWETEQVKGSISDWTLEDLDKDGRVEIIYCVNVEKGNLLNKKQTIVMVEKL